MGKISPWGKYVIWIKLRQIYATFYPISHYKYACEISSIVMGCN